MRKLLIGVGIVLFFPLNVFAQEVRTNNKYGIHLAVPNPQDIETAAELVNSSGGEWGYITLVIHEDDRDVGKWQEVFNKLRKLHLIPLIRLATKPEGDYWRAPTAKDAPDWVAFLNNLNWVVKDRHVILFNEPNHHGEWGGAVDPETYAEVALAFARALKAASPDYVIMPAGFDASAPSAPPIHEDEEVFLRALFTPETVSEWNKLLSGWSSHSYPNPAFAGPATATGRGTVRTYQWEQLQLAKLGVKRLPVYITETGWDAHAVTAQTAATRMEYALREIWTPDPIVKAITPFLLTYPAEPFEGFSWMSADGTKRPVFTTVQGMQKPQGKPEIIDTAILKGSLPYELVEGSLYRFPIKIRNAGQAIWEIGDGHKLHLSGLNETYYYASNLDNLEPGQEREVLIYAQTLTDSPGERVADLVLYKGRDPLQNVRKWEFSVVKRPSLEVNVQYIPPFFADHAGYELQVFDDQEQLVYKKRDLEVKNGTVVLDAIPNVLFRRPYRIVLLRPGYLPRQGHLAFRKGENNITYPPALPIDFNEDGTFSLQDIPVLFGGK